MITKQTKAVGIIGAIALLGGIAVFVGLLYVVSVRQESLQKLVQEQSVAEAKQTQLTALADLVIDTKEDREMLASHVVTENSVIDFLSLIEETARGQGLEIKTKSLNVRPLSGNEIFELLTLTTEIQGTLDGVLVMIALFESLPFQITILNVSLDNVAGDNVGTEWRGTFNIEVTKQI